MSKFIKNTVAYLTFTSFLSAAYISRFSIKDRIFFAKRLAFLLGAQVPLPEALLILKNQAKTKFKQEVFGDLAAEVASGHFLSTGLEKYKYLFGDFSIQIIRIGEQTGMLASNLLYLADELTKSSLLRNKIRSALVYPLFIVIATIGMTSFLTIFIFPKIMPIFTSLSIPLPITTRILLSTSQYLKEWGLITLLVFIVLIILYRVMLQKSEATKTLNDRVILKLPIIGTLIRVYNCANFCRTFGLVLNAGIPYTEALYTTGSTTSHTLYKRAISIMVEKSSHGEQASIQVAKFAHLFPDTLVHLIAIGEKTGRLTETLQYLAKMYEEELDEKTRNLSGTIEPILLTSMGLLVGTIAVSVIAPIYEVTQSLQYH